MRNFLVCSACVIFSSTTFAADPAPPPAACPTKTKSKIAAVEKKSVGFAKKVEAYKAKHKSVAPTNGRMPASFCTDDKNGMVKAAHLAREGFPLTDELELIENAPHAGECASLARAARVKVDQLFMDLNRAYIQTCATPP